MLAEYDSQPTIHRLFIGLSCYDVNASLTANFAGEIAISHTTAIYRNYPFLSGSALYELRT